MKWLVIQTRLSVHARLSTANIIKIFIKTLDHLEKRASVSPTNTLLSDLPLKLKSLFFYIFFFSRGAFDVNKLYHKIVLKICCLEMCRRFGKGYIQISCPLYTFKFFYLICSIVNVYFVTIQNNVCFRMSL